MKLTKVLAEKEQASENIEAIIKKLNHDIHLQKLQSGKLKIIIGIILLGINFIAYRAIGRAGRTGFGFLNRPPIRALMAHWPELFMQSAP